MPNEDASAQGNPQNTSNLSNATASLTFAIDFEVTLRPQPIEISGVLRNQNNGSVFLSLMDDDGQFLFGTGITGDDTSDPVGLFNSFLGGSPGDVITRVLEPGSYQFQIDAFSGTDQFNFPDRAEYDVNLQFVPEPATAGILMSGLLILTRRSRSQTGN